MPLFHPAIWRQQLRDAAVYWLLIPGAVTLSGMALDRLLHLPAIPGILGIIGGGICLLPGIWLIAQATRDLESLGGGTPNPFRPAKALVTHGSYHWCRHPMFFGYDLAALGVVLLLRSWATLLVSLPVMLAWQRSFLTKEESLLSRRFGADYDTYKKQVPMLLPWPRSKGCPTPEE